MVTEPIICLGAFIELDDELDCIIPPGLYRVTHVNADGSFHVNDGNTAVWSRRIVRFY